MPMLVTMSGRYNAMQHIKSGVGVLSRSQKSEENKNSLVDYIPCDSHSLNLIGQSVVDCCVEACVILRNFAKTVHFLLVSTHRWRILIHLEVTTKCLIPKHPSANVRWFAGGNALFTF